MSPKEGGWGAGRDVSVLRTVLYVLVLLLPTGLLTPGPASAQIPAIETRLERALDALATNGRSDASRHIRSAAGAFDGVASRNANWMAARLDTSPVVAHGPGRGPEFSHAAVSPWIPGWLFNRGDEGLQPGFALLSSAILPGAGQFLQGNDRWIPYLALELWGWISFFKQRSDAHDLAADYRDLAWFVARRVSIGERRDTIFEYYEEMTHYASSGTFDSDPEMAGIQPEFDVRTFNGDLWALSRGLFWRGQNFQPGTEPYQQALDHYLDHAIPPTFTWAWGDSFLEQQSFRDLIRRSDEAYRTSTQFLGLILANHVVSAVDALVIGRLRSAGGESRFRIGSGFEPANSRTPRLRIEASWRW